MRKQTSKKVDDTSANDMKMLNVRLQKKLVKRIKRACLEEEMTIQAFISEAAQEKLKKKGY